MTHDEAFMEAIRAQPDDDAPRLIYADWLEEHGQSERAEFIRIQCERAQVPECSPRWFELSVREEALSAAYFQEWLGPWRDSLSGKFERGFLEFMEIDAARFLELGGELFRRSPVRKALLRLRESLIQKLSESALLDELVSLQLGSVSSEMIRTLGNSPHLSRLTTLKLNAAWLNAERVAVLRQTPLFAQLHSLDLGDNDLRATGVEYLVDTREQVQLTELNLETNTLGSAGLQALTSARSLYSRLTRLNVTDNGVSAPGNARLAHTAASLSELRIGWNPVGDDGVRELASSEVFTALTVLDLERVRLGSDSAVALAQSPYLHRLTELNLRGNHMGKKAALAIASSPALARLEVLDLSGNEIGDEGVKALANSPHLSNLRALYLAVNGVRPWGIRELVMSPHLNNLYILDLHGNNLRDEGAQVIARWSRLPQLTVLDLHSNRIGDLGAKELADSPHLACLRELDLHNNEITDDCAAFLKNSPLSQRLVRPCLDDPENDFIIEFCSPSNS